MVARWLAVVALVGCGSARDTQRSLVEPPHARAATPAPAPTEGPGSQPRATSNTTAEPAGAGAIGSLEPSAPKAALASPLPSDVVFLLRSLDPLDYERYARFAEHSRIEVGKGQLQSFDRGADPDVLFVSSAEEASVRVYSRSAKRLRRNIPVADFAPLDTRAMLGWPGVGKNGENLFVVGSERGLTLVSSEDGTSELLAEQRVHGLRWSPDWNILIASTSDVATQTSVLTFYQRYDRILKPIARQAFDERVDGCALSADNRLLALSLYPSGDVRVIDLATQTDWVRTPGPSFNGDVEFSPDGRHLAVGGGGLLVIDLLNPARRAFYSHLGNNIARVHFSPSGDAIVTSSFDGRLRIFGLRDLPLAAGDSPNEPGASATRTGLELVLLKTLRHTGTANVYDFLFAPDGALLSASGDRTLREFRDTARTSEPPRGERRRFLTLDQWRSADPAGALPWPSPAVPPTLNGHYRPAELSGPARPALLRPGAYACKIGEIYKLRECTVSRETGGYTVLSFGAGNLLELDAVVFADGDVTRLSGWLTQESSIVGCRGCEKQPIHGLLRGSGNNWKGVLTFRNYYDPYVLPPRPAADVKLEESLDSFPIELHYRGEGPATSKRSE